MRGHRPLTPVGQTSQTYHNETAVALIWTFARQDYKMQVAMAPRSTSRVANAEPGSRMFL